MVSFFDLNTRHEATLFWIAVLVIILVWSPAMRTSARQILKSFTVGVVSLIITGLMVLVAVLTTLAVIVGRWLGLLDTLPVIAASVWFLTSGFSLLFSLGEIQENRRIILSRVRAVFVPSALIAAVFGVPVLPLWWEILVAPFLLALVVISIKYASKPSATAANVVLSIYASILIIVAVMELLESPAALRALAQGILFPMWLSLGSLPYVLIIIAVERYRFGSGVKSKIVYAADYGAEWPLTVNSVKLCCKHSAVWVEHDRRKYGLNGFAKGLLSKNGHRCFELEEIWGYREVLFSNPTEFEMRIPIGRLLRDGLALEHEE